MSDSKKKHPRYCHLCGRTNKTVFKFPYSYPKRELQWRQFCNLSRIDLLQVPYLCELHFDDRCFNRKSGKTYLNKTAIPTIRVDKTNPAPQKKVLIKRCSICGPTSASVHKFPQNANRKGEWLDILNEQVVDDTSNFLCDAHFAPEYLIRTPGGKTILTKDAKPLSENTEKSESDTALDNDVLKPILKPDKLVEVREVLEKLINSDNKISSDSSQGKSDVSHDPENPITYDMNVITDTSIENLMIDEEQEEFPGNRISNDSSQCKSDVSHDSRNPITYDMQVIVVTSIENLMTEEESPGNRVAIDSSQGKSDVSHDSENPITYDMNVIADTSIENFMIDEEIENLMIDEEQEESRGNRQESETIRTSGRRVETTPTKSERRVEVKRKLRYIGDIDTPSLNSPHRRRECLSIIRHQYPKMRTEMINLRQQNRRLKLKIENFKDLLKDLRKKGLISKDAEAIFR